jgi:hypothetical protein
MAGGDRRLSPADEDEIWSRAVPAARTPNRAALGPCGGGRKASGPGCANAHESRQARCRRPRWRRHPARPTGYPPCNAVRRVFPSSLVPAQGLNPENQHR